MVVQFGCVGEADDIGGIRLNRLGGDETLGRECSQPKGVFRGVVVAFGIVGA